MLRFIRACIKINYCNAIQKLQLQCHYYVNYLNNYYFKIYLRMGIFKYIIACALFFCSSLVFAQQNVPSGVDSAAADSTRPDSLQTAMNNAIVKVPDSILYKDYMPLYLQIKTGPGSDSSVFQQRFPQSVFESGVFGLNKRSVFYIDQPHTHHNKDTIFYVLVGILIVLAVVVYFFDDYFAGFLQSFTQPTYRLSLTNENYALGFFPAFLLNLLFVITAGLFITEITSGIISRFSFWDLFGIYSILIALIYIFKLLVLKISGYLFNATYAAKLYTHIVFMVNKFIGILLIPVLWAISFSTSPENDPLVRNMYSIFTILFIVLILYRYFVSFVLIKNNLKINAFHFFIYLCAVEIIPILIIYKFLTDNISNWL